MLTDVKLDQRPRHRQQERHQPDPRVKAGLRRRPHHPLPRQLVDPLGILLGALALRQRARVQVRRGHVQEREQVQATVDEGRCGSECGELGGGSRPSGGAGLGGQSYEGRVDEGEEWAGDPQGEAGEVEFEEG